MQKIISFIQGYRQRVGKKLFFTQVQIALVVVLVSIFVFFFYNATVKMSHQGMNLGFSFFSTQSKFDIQFSLIEYSGSSSYGRAYLVGILNTLLVAMIGIFFTTIVGFFVGLMRMSKHFLLQKSALIYIELFRNIPLLLQILFWYFLILRYLPPVEDAWNFFEIIILTIKGVYLPDFIFSNGWLLIWSLVISALGVFLWLKWSKQQKKQTGQSYPRFWVSLAIPVIILIAIIFLGDIRLDLRNPQIIRIGNVYNFEGGIAIIPELIALAIALILYTSTFFAECVRAGIASIRRGQRDAAASLGLSKSQSLRLVIIPQALRVIIPPATNQYLNLTKNSSLAAAIGYPDLFNILAGTTLNQTGRAIEVIFITMMSYLSISLMISVCMNWYNKRWAIKN